MKYYSVNWKTSSDLILADHSCAFSSEEEGSLFLWAWPRLIGWHVEVEWLFSPVVGQLWPGDVWGIDKNGDLLLVETKKATQAENPMVDFVGYAQSKPKDGKNPLVYTELIQKRWEDLLKQEQSFIKQTEETTGAYDWWNDTHPGIVPYSSKRYAIRKWPSVYLEMIVPRLKASSYVENVRSWLAKRERYSCATHYIGLFSVPFGCYPRLSKQGKAKIEDLRNEVGEQKVHWRAVGIQHLENGNFNIYGWNPQL